MSNEAIKDRFRDLMDAQVRFLQVAQTVDPGVFKSLCSLEGIELAREAMQESFMVANTDASDKQRGAEESLRTFLLRWQRRWDLMATPHNIRRGSGDASEWLKAVRSERVTQRDKSRYSWVTAIAERTLYECMWAKEEGGVGPDTFVHPFPEKSRQVCLADRHLGEDIRVPIQGFDMQEYFVSDRNLSLLKWHPRTESREAARKRLIDVLDKALDQVEMKDPEFRVPLRSMRLLAHYQFTGESQETMAKSFKIDRATVTKTINETAALLALRPRSPRPGRPRKPHPAWTVKK